MKNRARFKINGKWSKWISEGELYPSNVEDFTVMETNKTMTVKEAVKIVPGLLSKKE